MREIIMDIKNLEAKVIKFMMADSSNSPKAINEFILLVAKDYTDVNDLRYFLILHDTLCKLESEGKVEDVSDMSSANRSKYQIIKDSRWRLKK